MSLLFTRMAKVILKFHINILDRPSMYTILRAVVRGGAWGALASPEFGSSVNPIPSRGADYAHTITASTPGFENLKTSLNMVMISSLASK